MSSIIARPKLRNLLIDRIKVHLLIAIGLGIASSVSAKIFWANPRRERINEFCRTYDEKAESERLRKMGFMDHKFAN